MLNLLSYYVNTLRMTNKIITKVNFEHITILLDVGITVCPSDMETRVMRCNLPFVGSARALFT